MKMPFRSQNEGSSRASSTVIVSEHERINGWQCPWHYLQFIAWFFLIFFAIGHFAVVVPCLNHEWRPAAYIIPAGLYIIHLFLHLMCLSIDPADPNIRAGSRGKASWFDRTQHKHVIENNHCYICQVDVFPQSKHCSVCNKCVADFDHHCKWLNNCIGGRNYRLFLGCVMSALVLSLVVFVMHLYVFIILIIQPEKVKSNLGGEYKLFVVVPLNGLLSFVAINCLLLLLAICLLGHLLGFHFYLIWHEITTYEFIVSGRNKQSKRKVDVESGERRPPKILPLKNNKVRPGCPKAQNVSASPDIPRENVEIVNELEPRIHVPRPNREMENSRPAPPAENDGKTEDYDNASSSEESLHPAAEATPEVTVQAASPVPPLRDILSISQTSEGKISFNEVNITPRTVTSVQAEVRADSSDSGEELIPVNQQASRRPECGFSPQTRVDFASDIREYKFHELKLEAFNDRSSSSSPVTSSEHVKRKTKMGGEGRKKKRKKRLKSLEEQELPPLVSRRPLPALPSLNERDA